MTKNKNKYLLFDGRSMSFKMIVLNHEEGGEKAQFEYTLCLFDK